MENEIRLPDSSSINIGELRKLRKKLFEREAQSLSIDNPQNNPQIHFPLKADGTVYDLGIIVARGLDQMIAALAIWEAKYPDNSDQHQSLDDALRKFWDELIALGNNSQLTPQDQLLLAKKSLKSLTGECLTHLGMQKTKRDFQTFLMVRDIVYKEHFGSYAVRSDLYSVKSASESGRIGTVLYEPLDFSNLTPSPSPESVNIPQQYESALKDPTNDGNGNEWVNKFLENHGSKLKTLSMTPMTRVAALPANAYKMTFQPEQDPEQDSATTVNYPSFYSMAFAVSFKDKNKESRKKSTRFNLQAMLTDHSVLTETATQFQSKWQPTQGVITLPLTYQTLITRIALKKMPDYDKSPNGLEEIAELVDELADKLKNKRFILEDNILEPICPGVIKLNRPVYQFCVLTANNCINRYHKISPERDRDYQVIKTLLDLTKAHIEREKNNDKNNNLNDDFDIITHFINKSDASYFTPYLSRGKNVKDALRRISQQNPDLGLLLSAAVELKVCSHETLFGRWHRLVLDKIQPRGLQQVIRVISFILATLVKIPLAPVLLSHWLKHHNSRRKLFYRAAYLNMVAAHLGRSVSSCMSSADREKELAAFIAALKADFHKKKKLLGFNDPVSDKISFIKQYQLSANQLKRNIVRIATGSPSTQDNELLPFFNQFGSRAGLFVEHSQKELNKLVKSLRYAKSALVLKWVRLTMAEAFAPDSSPNSTKSSGVTFGQAFSPSKPNSLILPAINFFEPAKHSAQEGFSNKTKWPWVIAGALLLGAAAALIFGTGGLGVVAIPLGILLKCLLIKYGLTAAASQSAVYVVGGIAALLAGFSFYQADVPVRIQAAPSAP
jgi:hypothetical protein